MSENREITRAAGVVGASTMASRILGLVRDIVIARYFGAGMGADAFFVAFRIPNFFRRLFAEGSMTASFIPVYTEYLHKGDEREAGRLLDLSFTLAGILLFVVTVAGVWGAEGLVYLLAAGFGRDPDKAALAVELTRWCFPYLFFIGLVALAMGILNARRHFFAPAFAPVLLNISMIGATLGLVGVLEPPVLALAVGVLLGGATQFLFQLPFLRREGVRWRPAFDLRHPGLRRILLLMGPSVFGLAITQITILVNTQLASFLEGGTVSYLYYADRLVELPLGVFAVAVGTATLPSLARLAAAGNREAYTQSLFYALRLTLYISIPAAVALVILREPIFRVLFQRGEFDPETTRHAARALLGYAVGLPFYSAVRVLVPGYYATQDTVTPVKAGAWALAANAVTGLSLMWSLQELGLALGTAVSGLVNTALLLRWMRPRLVGVPWSEVGRTTARCGAASVAMAAALLWARTWVPWLETGGTATKAAALAGAVFLGGGIYLVATLAFGSRETRALAEILRARFRRR